MFQNALLLLAIPLGLTCADLLSGLVHWFCDTFLSEEAPLLGRAFIAPFREHHRDPEALLRHDLIARNASNAIAALPIALLGCIPGTPLFVLAFALTCAVAVLGTNQIHAWAHAASAPRIVRWLQACGVVLSPEAHAAHHGERGDVAYCVTTGWMNAILDRTGFFRLVEHVLTRAGVPRAAS